MKWMIVVIPVMASSAMTAAQVPSGRQVAIGERLAASLGDGWQVKETFGRVALDMVIDGWPLRGYCSDELPASVRVRLDQLDKVFTELARIGIEREVKVTVDVKVVGEADAAVFRRGKPLGPYQCNGELLDGDNLASDQARLARYRAMTVHRAILRAHEAGMSVVLGGISLSEEWRRDRWSSEHRAARLHLEVTTRAVVTMPELPPVADVPIEVQTAPSGLEASLPSGEITKGTSVPAPNSIAWLGLAAGVLSPMSARARAQDFGPSGLIAASFRAEWGQRSRVIASIGGMLARRADGEIILNSRSEHYSLTMVGLGLGIERGLRWGRVATGIGPQVSLLNLRRRIILNSSLHDQNAWAAAIGVGFNVAIPLIDGFDLWFMTRCDLVTLGVAGGVSHPITGQITLGLLHPL